MRAKLIPANILVGLAAVLVLLGESVSSAQAAAMKFEVQLVWATDDASPPAGKDYKKVQSDTLRKMLKWKNYFEVKRIPFDLAPGTTKKVAISEKCQLDVKDLGGSNVEVVQFGKGKETARHKQALPKGETLVLGGNAPNETAWLVILKRIE